MLIVVGGLVNDPISLSFITRSIKIWMNFWKPTNLLIRSTGNFADEDV